MKRLLLVLCWLLISGGVVAQTPAERLAGESYAFVVAKESMLEGAIRSGSKDDFYRFIYKPAIALMQQWPQLGDDAYDRLRRCQFALDSFRVYAEGQFNAAGSLPKSAPSAKTYFEQKALCRKALRK